jgi:hypothetical protein
VGKNLAKTAKKAIEKASEKLTGKVKPAQKPKAAKAPEPAIDYTKTIKDQFQGIRDTLLSTHTTHKQARALKLALEGLDMAEECANRHIRHNVR